MASEYDQAIADGKVLVTSLIQRITRTLVSDGSWGTKLAMVCNVLENVRPQLERLGKTIREAEAAVPRSSSQSGTLAAVRFALGKDADDETTQPGTPDAIEEGKRSR